tara:strand:- start:249 stop:710 length:462 start_codon:yes stop_codon:yes gene_type:complete
MIITCQKCEKSFNIQDNLIPDEGRELQCGSCNYKWFFIKSENSIPVKNEISETLSKDDYLNNVNTNPPSKKKEKDDSTKQNEQNKKSRIKIVQKNPKIIKNSLVLIISVLALIILLDTFKYQINNYIPDFVSILNNLYESLKDLSLFFNDLIN